MVSEPLFPEASVARRIDREMFVLLGGTAALLLQIAHPLVAAGVAQHSRFREEPFARLHRTLDTTLSVVFGTPAQANAALRRIDRRHVSVTGTAADGRAYAARDPRLLLWVQTTLVLTSLRFYELVLGPLRPDEREAYWAETRPIASRLGIPEGAMPATLAQLERFEAEMLRGEVLPDGTALELARYIRRPLPVPSFLYAANDTLTAGLLPAPLRAAFGLRWSARDRLLFRAVVVSLRLLRIVLPDRLTVVPHARRLEGARAR